MYEDVSVFDIGEDPAPKKKNDPTSDIKHFFSDFFIPDGQKKKRRHCKICDR